MFEVVRFGRHDLCNFDVTSDGDLARRNASRVTDRVWGCVSKPLTFVNGIGFEEATISFAPSDLETSELRCDPAYAGTDELCQTPVPHAWSL